jgi:hypothetical protein
MLARLVMTVLAVSPLGSCVRHAASAHVLGTSTASASKRLGVDLTAWQHASIPGYEISCTSEPTVLLYGEHASVCLVREGEVVAAVAYRIEGCTGRRYDALRAAVLDDYGISGGTDRDVYVVRGSGVVHLRPADGAAQLVVTDSAFGDLYVKEQLRQGFVDLSNGLRPH